MGTALTMIREKSKLGDDEYEILLKIARDSIPSVRMRLLPELLNLCGSTNLFVKTAELVEGTKMPTNSVKTVLDDLYLLGVVECRGERPFRWRFNKKVLKKLADSDLLPNNNLQLSVVQLPGCARE